ncbi:MAG: CCXG family PEP-CTERM protein [Burkholderiales bacterium]
MNALLRTVLVASLALAGAAHSGSVTHDSPAPTTGARTSAADFGLDNAAFLDGVALDYNSNDVWWKGSCADASPSLQLGGLQPAACHHKPQYHGLGHCCDGNQQMQFGFNDGQFQTVAANDALTPAVAEPETYALMLGGLGALVFMARRRSAD